MDKGFEKKLLILMMFAVMILGYISITYANEGLENQYPGIMRFHVIANSDSTADQTLKLEVRDYVLERLQRNITEEIMVARNDSQNTLSESQIIREYIQNNLSIIEQWADEAITQAGFDYHCVADVGVRHIPAKYYDEIFFPEGNYEALNLTIGEGKGQNWWCVVFPPLCLIDSENSLYSDTFQVSQEDKLLLKSKVKEMIEKEPSHEEASLQTISTCLSISMQKFK